VVHRVRLKDIARDLKVSAAAVSKALSDADDISASLKRRVLKRVAELGYSPDVTARCLATRRTFVVGLVIPDLTHSFFADIAKGAAKVLHVRDYTLILANSEENAELERQEVNQLLARRVDGVILASAQPQDDPSMFLRIREQRTPLVLVDRWYAGFPVDFSGTDNAELGRMATEHLFQAGCRRIAHLACPHLGTGPGRLQGYREVIEKHGLPFDEGWVANTENNDSGAYDAAMRLLAHEPRPDGLFCFSDPVAAGAEQAILDAGLRIPEDIAVIGAGNVHYSNLFRVPLSTVDMGSALLGERAAELLLARMEGRQGPLRRLLGPLRIVVRQSTQRPALGMTEAVLSGPPVGARHRSGTQGGRKATADLPPL